MSLAHTLAALLIACASPMSALAQAQAPEPQPTPSQAEPAAPAQPGEAPEPPEEMAADPDASSKDGKQPSDQPARRRLLREPRTFSVKWEAPEELRKLFEEHLPPPRGEVPEGRRGATLRPWIRDVRKKAPEIAASEGYFSATVEVEFIDEARSQIVVKLEPGARTVVGAVEMTFKGDIAGEGPRREKRRRQLQEGFAMQQGAPFRSSDWDTAKARLAEDIAEEDYAAGELTESRAVVDAESGKATLKLVVDSGPPFTLGDVEITGLEKYSESIVRRSVDVRRGERYHAKRLLDLQRRIQEGPWFASVVIDVPRDREHPEMVPVKIALIEKPRVDVGVSLGYGTDDGARVEAAYRNRDLIGRGFDLQSSLRISEERQFGYADVYLPPGLQPWGKRGNVPFQDSVGVLVEHSTFSNLDLSRFAVAGYRVFKLETFETRVGLTYQIERSKPEGADEALKRALAPIVAFTWRHVDNLFDPKKGGVLNVQVAAGSKELASGDDFVKLYGQYQYWIPLGAMDQLVLRTELGRTFTDHRERIPEDFLYRAGGSRSNRGYAYQSLGVEEGQATVGGRYLATGSIEYVHWLNERWGAATFLDVGDATDSTSDWKANPSYGVGARFKTPAGPFAIDLAYAQDLKKFRLAFSVTVAF